MTEPTTWSPGPRAAEPPSGEPPAIDVLLGLVHEPLLAAARARARRDLALGRRVRIVARDPMTAPEHAAIVRAGATVPTTGWPAARGVLHEGDHVVVQVGTEPGDRERYVRWLHELARHDQPRWSLAPCSRTAAGLHPLWCIAVARLCLPVHVAIEARHDLLGIRLAQVALGFGADALGGPIEHDRSLPLCGVTRPDENTATGLATLVRQAGLQPELQAEVSP